MSEILAAVAAAAVMLAATAAARRFMLDTARLGAVLAEREADEE